MAGHLPTALVKLDNQFHFLHSKLRSLVFALPMCFYGSVEKTVSIASSSFILDFLGVSTFLAADLTGV